jgi:hypothetical protein
VIAPYALLADGRRYMPVPTTSDLIASYEAGSILPIPAPIVELIEARPHTGKRRTNSADGAASHAEAGARETAYALAALDGCVAELAGTAAGDRNERLNRIAYRLGRMVARQWVARSTVEAALLAAMQANGGIDDDGLAAAKATLRSGLDAGIAEPHPDLAEQDDATDGTATTTAAVAGAEPPPRVSLEDLHKVFRTWFGDGYDLDVIDVVLAAAAVARLDGDPLWVLVVSGSGNTKTETVQALAGCGAYVTSTISSEGALLSAAPRKARGSTGGLLRKIGDRGTVVIKDVTSILSADRNVRGGVLAALREIYDGRWERNVGSDGGSTLTSTGRLTVIGAVTTAWDASYGVIGVMGDRFVLVRSDSTVHRTKAGLQALRNVGRESAMRTELAAAVGGLIGHIEKAPPALDQYRIEQLVRIADLVTFCRTPVERDFHGDVVDGHAPEAATRFGKQLLQVVRGGVAIGLDLNAAMQLALRCARDSLPQLRLAVLLDLAEYPRSRATEVCSRVVRPYRTIRRELEALHTLGLLDCVEEQATSDEARTIWRYSLALDFDRGALLSIGGLTWASH